jgi:hypothetical protein
LDSKYAYCGLASSPDRTAGRENVVLRGELVLMIDVVSLQIKRGYDVYNVWIGSSSSCPDRLVPAVRVTQLFLESSIHNLKAERGFIALWSSFINLWHSNDQYDAEEVG